MPTTATKSNTKNLSFNDFKNEVLNDYKVARISRECSLLGCLLYTYPSPRDRTRSRMPSSA